MDSNWRGRHMVAFLGSFLQYVVEMVAIGLLAFIAIKLGILWAKHDNKKAAAAKAAEDAAKVSAGSGDRK